MCSVGEEIGTVRQIWSNDAQHFASEVAHAIFVSREAPLSALSASDILFRGYSDHQVKLSLLLDDCVRQEVECGAAPDFEHFSGAHKKLGETLETRSVGLIGKNYVLFSRMYANSYIGTAQAIEIDSIVYSISRAVRTGAISLDQKRWLYIALGRAILKCSTTTGHFAQFLRPKPGSYRTFLRQRRRRIWNEWLESVELLSPVGSASWRVKNRVFNEDALTLVKRLRRMPIRPSVIYADPPYTDDQYSRFYHLLETLLMYDYPKVSGKGRYRSKRFQTAFSLRSQVAAAFHGLIRGVADSGADLILSYPSNGLLLETGENPLSILREHFSRADCYMAVSHKHSTLGGSKGEVVGSVTEFIYMAKQ
jgi:adenine-specific DNA-methyltransferase